MTLRTFDPKELSVTFGEFIMKGFSDDVVSIAFDDPSWELVVGADGEGARVKSNSNAATITITLQQVSPSNDDLSGIWLLDKISNAGIRPFFAKDNLGTSIWTAPTAFIEQIPEAGYSKTQNDRVWILKTDNLIPFLGGNNAA